MRIGLVGLMYDNNLGDPLMLECVQYLLKSELDKKNVKNYTFKYIDLFGRNSNDNLINYKNSKLNKLFLLPLRLVTKLSKHKFQKTNNFFEDMMFKYDVNGSKRLRGIFREQLRDVDYIIIVGGALVKFRLIRNFHYPLFCLIDEANSYPIDIIFNSVGIENGYNMKFHGCKIVNKYLNYPNVKYVTTRDDMTSLKKYVGNNKMIDVVADSAVWVDEIFNIDINNKSDIVGIGVIDPLRFSQYNNEKASIDYYQFIINLITLINKHEYKWKIFTNGHIDDFKFAESIIKELGEDKSRLVPRPANHFQLINTINSFKMIVASRLHACIIGYGLNKQIIGIDWNDKLIYFGDLIGSSESFFKPTDVSAEVAFNILKNKIESKYDQNERETYRNTVKKSIKIISDLILNTLEKEGS